MAEKRTAMKHKQEESRSLKKPLENMNSFPYKLWSLVNDETLTAIHWSEDGEKVVIDNPTKFTAKVLTNCHKKIFKTKNISSFIRQLNLYGFRRVKKSSAKLPMIFEHDSFKRGRSDLLGEVKRKKPLSNKVLHPGLLITPPHKSRHKTTETQGEEPRISNSRYPYLPTSLNYSYFNTSNLTKKNVHMPFVTVPFAVNHGPTFINVGSNSTIYSKQRELEQTRISQDDAENLITQHPVAENQGFHTLHQTSEVVPYYPWQRRGYYTPQEPGTSASNSPYGNDMAYQAMRQNQVNYANYPPTYLNMFPAVTHATNYRNYGDASESMSYTDLPSYTGPVNSVVRFSHHTPAQIESNSFDNHTTSKTIQTIPGKLLKFKIETSTACCSSVYEAPTSDVSSSYFSDDGHEQKKTVVNGKAFPSFSANEEK